MTDDPEVVTLDVPPDPDVIEVVVAAEIEVVEVVVPADVEVIQIAIPGEQGPAGRPGPAGSGEGGSGQEFVQTAAAGTWIITHGLGRRPGVSVYDTTGAELIAEVFADASNVTVIFANPTAGSAVLS